MNRMIPTVIAALMRLPPRDENASPGVDSADAMDNSLGLTGGAAGGDRFALAHVVGI